LNQDRTDDEMDAIVKDCTLFLKNNHHPTNSQPIDCFAVPYNFEITL
jgi:hypothetical protein